MQRMRLMVSTSDVPGHVTVQLQERQPGLGAGKVVWKKLDERTVSIEGATMMLNQAARVADGLSAATGDRMAFIAHAVVEGLQQP